MRTRSKTALALLGGLAVIGCSSQDPNDGAQGGADPSAIFVGTWKCSTKAVDLDSSTTTTFDTTYVGDNLGNGQISLTRPDIDCPAVKLTVAGNVATALSGQTCPRPDGTTLTYESYTATSDGTLMSLESHYDFSGATPRTETSTCYHP
jgi:hypothetical protein